jgi:mono/diheme cytochrome c family protein
MSPLKPKMYLSGVLALMPVTAGSAAKVEYNRDIRPILSDKCFQCHGPDPATREGDMRLDIRAEAVEAGAIVPGEPAESELITRIHESDPDEVMPPPDSPRQLTAADRETLRKWIAQGAEYQPLWSLVPLP